MGPRQKNWGALGVRGVGLGVGVTPHHHWAWPTGVVRAWGVQSSGEAGGMHGWETPTLETPHHGDPPGGEGVQTGDLPPHPVPSHITCQEAPVLPSLTEPCPWHSPGWLWQ